MRTLPESDPKTIHQALRILRKGGVIVYPTETAYGLGGDWTNPAAHRKIRLIKGRGKEKKLSVIVSSYEMAEQYVTFPKTARTLARAHWPGPLSLVLPLKHAPVRFSPNSSSPEWMTHPAALRSAPLSRGDSPPREGSPEAGVGTLSVRISSHPLAMKLVRALGRPLIATSANVSGKPSLYSAAAVARAFARRRHRPDLIFDAGELKHVKPSTVVAIKGNAMEVLREGPIKIKSKFKMQK